MTEGLRPKERMSRALRGERVDCLPAAPYWLGLFLPDLACVLY